MEAEVTEEEQRQGASRALEALESNGEIQSGPAASFMALILFGARSSLSLRAAAGQLVTMHALQSHTAATGYSHPHAALSRSLAR